MKSKKQQLLAAAAAVVIMVFAWYQVVWTGQTKAIAKAGAAKATATASAKQLTARANQLEAAKADPAREKLLAKLNAAVPDEPHLSEYLRYITDLADKTHVVLPTVGHTTPTLSAADIAVPVAAPSANAPIGSAAAPAPTGGPAAAAGDPLYQVTLTIQANGTYADILEFVHQLELSPRLIIVDTLGLAGGENNTTTAPADGSAPAVTVPGAGNLTATISARMFSVKGLDTATSTGVTP